MHQIWMHTNPNNLIKKLKIGTFEWAMLEMKYILLTLLHLQYYSSHLKELRFLVQTAREENHNTLIEIYYEDNSSSEIILIVKLRKNCKELKSKAVVFFLQFGWRKRHWKHAQTYMDAGRSTLHPNIVDTWKWILYRYYQLNFFFSVIFDYFFIPVFRYFWYSCIYWKRQLTVNFKLAFYYKMHTFKKKTSLD